MVVSEKETRNMPKLQGLKKRDKLDTIKYSILGVGIFFIIISFILNRLSGTASELGPIFLIAGILVSVGPYSLLNYYVYARARKMEEYFPTFLRDYSEAINSGLTFSQALTVTAKTDYGSLTPELKRAADLLSWGVPFPKVLDKMAHRMRGSRAIRQAFTIVKESYLSGGDIATTMNSVSSNIIDIRNIRAERKAILSQQVWIMYVIYFVFLGITIALYKLLIPITTIGMQTGDVSTGSVSLGSLSISSNINYCTIGPAKLFCGLGSFMGYDPEEQFTYFRTLFLFLAAIQGIFSGIIIGELMEGKAVAGIKHAAILVSSALIVFLLFI